MPGLTTFDQALPSQAQATSEGSGQRIPSNTTSREPARSQNAFAYASCPGPGPLSRVQCPPIRIHPSLSGVPWAPGPPAGLNPEPPDTKRDSSAGSQSTAAPPRPGGLGPMSTRVQVLPSHDQASPK